MICCGKYLQNIYTIQFHNLIKQRRNLRTFMDTTQMNPDPTQIKYMNDALRIARRFLKTYYLGLETEVSKYQKVLAETIPKLQRFKEILKEKESKEKENDEYIEQIVHSLDSIDLEGLKQSIITLSIA